MTRYVTKGFPDTFAAEDVHRLDCMDCDNRPAHKYQTSDDVVALAMGRDANDLSLPWIKSSAVAVLTREYNNDAAPLHPLQSPPG